MNFRSAVSGAMFVSDPPLPKTLEPGDPIYVVGAPLHELKRDFFEHSPGWAWAEDNYGTVSWARVSQDVREAIRLTKRRMKVDNDYGGFDEVEIDDHETSESASTHDN